MLIKTLAEIKKGGREEPTQVSYTETKCNADHTHKLLIETHGQEARKKKEDAVLIAQNPGLKKEPSTFLCFS